jgi:hypothetical protein
MNDSSISEGLSVNRRCPSCGQVQPFESNEWEDSAGHGRDCRCHIPATHNQPQEIDESLDAWLDGERASVRSRRLYGELPYR